MAGEDYIPRPDPVEVAQRTKNSREDGAPGRRKSVNLGAELKSEQRIALRAMEETLAAREERDQYRRILAASIKGEQVASERCAVLERNLGDEEVSRSKLVAEAGRLNGRNAELDGRLQALTQSHQERVAALQAELRHERECFERSLGEGALDRGRLEGRLRELERSLDHGLPTAMRMLRVRATGLFVLAGVLWATALALLPPLARALFGSSTPEEMLLATGTSGWGLLVKVLVVAGLGLVLFTLGMRDHRASAVPCGKPGTGSAPRD